MRRPLAQTNGIDRFGRPRFVPTFRSPRLHLAVQHHAGDPLPTPRQLPAAPTTTRRSPYDANPARVRKPRQSRGPPAPEITRRQKICRQSRVPGCVPAGLSGRRGRRAQGIEPAGEERQAPARGAQLRAAVPAAPTANTRAGHQATTGAASPHDVGAGMRGRNLTASTSAGTAGLVHPQSVLVAVRRRAARQALKSDAARWCHCSAVIACMPVTEARTAGGRSWAEECSEPVDQLGRAYLPG